MKDNRYKMAAMATSISLSLDREYKLIVDFQWYGLKDGQLYSYLLASAHEPKAEPSPPYYLTMFCMGTGKILPLNITEAKKAIALFARILDNYDDVKLKGLTTNDLKKLKQKDFKRVKNNHFFIPHSNLRVLTGEYFKPVMKPSVCILWGSLELPIVDFHRVVGKGVIDYLTFNLNLEFNISLRSLDFRDDIKLYFEFGKGKQLTFTAYLTEVIPISNSSVQLKSSNFSEELKRQKMGLLSAKNCDARDLIYLILRMGGMPSDRINFDGFTTKGYNIFTVIFPIQNLRLITDFSLGNVDFISGTPYLESDFINQHSEAMIKLGWDQNNVATRVNVSANSFYDAYILASEEVERALDIISHFTRNSAPFVDYSVKESLYKWVRSTEVPILKRALYALIINDTKGGNILLDWTESREPNELENNDVIQLLKDNANYYEEAMFYRKEPNKTKIESNVKALLRSLRWLRRSWESEDLVDKVIYASTALEFSVVGVQPASFLLDNDTELIIDVAMKTLKDLNRSEYNKDTLGALKQKVSQAITNPPLMSKVHHVIKELGIPISNLDLSLLKKIREQRNKVLHGGTEKQLTSEDMVKVHGVISRIVSARINEAMKKLIEGTKEYV